MSLVISNFQLPDRSHGFTDAEAQSLTVEQFDKLPLSERMNLYNNHPSEYARLSGEPYEQAEANTPTPTKTREEMFAEAFEKAVDDAFIRVCGHKAGES